MTFDDWYDTVVKHVTPADIYQWMYEAWDAGQQAEREACAKLIESGEFGIGNTMSMHDDESVAAAIRARSDHG